MNNPKQLSIKCLLDGKDNYIIPMYQRNYAWGEGEITQLIQDIIDYRPDNKNYYIGTLVVFKQPNSKNFETIDGQQRLTTLSLLASYIKNTKIVNLSWYENLNIHFDSRKNSEKTFANIFKGNDLKEMGEESNAALLNGYRLIKKILPQKLKENQIIHNGLPDFKAFADYLLNKVQIMRVEVPHDTDLNHYFEIMNSRGEQLEKHEILKSRMMEVLNGITDAEERKFSQNCLHVVWEACSNMEKYVQMGFKPKQRDAVFGNEDWGQLTVKNFTALCNALNASGEDSPQQFITKTLHDIITQTNKNTEKYNKEDESPERFNTVINFPNFLLHVLQVISKENIPLDDKKLIATFESHIFKSKESIDIVKKFIFGLLRCKYLFDHYVIKREFIGEKDQWSLKRFKRNDGGEKNSLSRGSYVNTFGEEDETINDNRSILMLLSAFHVSTPTMVYKHWLNGTLYYLYRLEKIESNSYLKYLESLAKAFVFDRFLAFDKKADYFSIIHANAENPQVDPSTTRDIKNLESMLSFENIENNFIFNYLDYLLWLKHKQSDPKIRDYKFTFRSSVEHYYPQSPMPGHTPLPLKTLNSFGNLCLISHSKNSRLSNFMPNAKKEYYQGNSIDSIKQHLMMNEKYLYWNAESITNHYEEMKNVLLQGI